MNRGRYLTQLGSNQDYSVIHCQVMDDMQTLKVDQGNGFLAMILQNRNNSIGVEPELGRKPHMCCL